MTNILFFKREFNLFWEFKKLPLEATFSDFEVVELLTPVSLPHDWLIYDTKNLYENSSGWYKKEFELNLGTDELYFIHFDGVYMDSTIYINGQIAGEWQNGYTAFEVDITPFIIDGKNSVVVQVRHQHPNSRWYSGAGVYRDVHLIKRNRNHIPLDGNYISIKKDGHRYSVEIETELVIDSDFILKHEIYDGENLITDVSNSVKNGSFTSEVNLEVIEWSIENPKLYNLVTTLHKDGDIYEELHSKIGFKDVEFSPTKGFFLNGTHVKLHGVCEHHDLGALGAAFNKTVMRNRMLTLKEMGVNAIRTAHTIPAKALLELTDEMGFLLVNEAYDMWDRAKTEYDYHRFFRGNMEIDIKSWIRRDRNHVSLLMWSIGNEIYDTHVDEKGLQTTKELIAEVLKHDPKANAVITLGSNFMPWENAQKCADVLKFAGYNYAERVYEEQHKQYPDWYIYGSETASIVQSRGVYHFPIEASILVDDNKQCSALGNSVTSWGAKSVEDVLTIDRDYDFSIGQFIWTGFDYIGEPTPYTTKNAYFGQIDTAGFRKDSFYAYKASWNSESMIHLYPYWQFNEGQIIDVRIVSNLPKVKLYLNDKLIDEQFIDIEHGHDIIPSFKVPFEKGVLRAEGYSSDGELVTSTECKSFFEANKLRVKTNKQSLKADGKDVVELEIEVLDMFDTPIADSRQIIEVKVSGAGSLLGVDNGDSTDYSQYKGSVKQLFQGKLKAYIGSTLESGQIDITISSPGLDDVTIILHSKLVELNEEQKIARDEKHLIRSGEFTSSNEQNKIEIPIERIELKLNGGKQTITDEKPTFVEAVIHPSNATLRDIYFSVTTDLGVKSNLATIEQVENGCIIKALGDGQFRLKCMANNKKSHADIISQLEFSVSGMGEAFKNPYEFISAGLYDDFIGEIGAGNKRGISTDNLGETTVIFENIDFGSFGSDRVTLPIFDFESKPLDIKLYRGRPESGVLMDTLNYDKKTIWDVYQEETYKLSERLQGIETLSMVFATRVHLKGFQFEKLKKGFEQLSILECDSLYGDSFSREEWGFTNIGNNVSFQFDDMDIDETVHKIEICGRSITERNSIRIQTTKGDSITNQIVEFVESDGFSVKIFELDPIIEADSVEFIFLPGSQFDFKWFRFIK